MTQAGLNKSDDRHHVAVVGGGFTGIQCIKSLKRADVRICSVQNGATRLQPKLCWMPL